ncbi:MAG: hypothetical protein KDA87_25955 [Planctomycetales bacterium]|nr:hypothetical protein [Planctomycetales bacterium]
MATPQLPLLFRKNKQAYNGLQGIPDGISQDEYRQLGKRSSLNERFR